jgi:hypothetical protein
MTAEGTIKYSTAAAFAVAFQRHMPRTATNTARNTVIPILIAMYPPASVDIRGAHSPAAQPGQPWTSKAGIYTGG